GWVRSLSMSRSRDRLRIIWWEVEMGNARVALGVVLVVVCARTAAAQSSSRPPIEIGAGAGGIVSWWTPSIPGGDVRISVPLSDRNAVELLVAMTPVIDRVTMGLYGFQIRRRFGKEDEEEHDFMSFFPYGAIC